MPNLIDFLNDLTQSKQDLRLSDTFEKDFNPFIVSRRIGSKYGLCIVSK